MYVYRISFRIIDTRIFLYNQLSNSSISIAKLRSSKQYLRILNQFLSQKTVILYVFFSRFLQDRISKNSSKIFNTFIHTIAYVDKKVVLQLKRYLIIKESIEISSKQEKVLLCSRQFANCHLLTSWLIFKCNLAKIL